MPIITCPECKTKYKVSADDLDSNGREVLCHKCQHRWVQNADIEKEDSLIDNDIIADIKALSSPLAKVQDDIDNITSEESPEDSPIIINKPKKLAKVSFDEDEFNEPVEQPVVRAQPAVNMADDYIEDETLAEAEEQDESSNVLENNNWYKDADEDNTDEDEETGVEAKEIEEEDDEEEESDEEEVDGLKGKIYGFLDNGPTKKLLPIFGATARFSLFSSPVILFCFVLYVFVALFIDNLPISDALYNKFTKNSYLTLEKFILNTEVHNRENFDLNISGLIANNGDIELKTPQYYTITLIHENGSSTRFLQRTHGLHKKIAPHGYIGVQSTLTALPLNVREVIIDMGDTRKFFCLK